MISACEEKLKCIYPITKLHVLPFGAQMGAAAAGFIGYIMFANDQESDKKC